MQTTTRRLQLWDLHNDGRVVGLARRVNTSGKECMLLRMGATIVGTLLDAQIPVKKGSILLEVVDKSSKGQVVWPAILRVDASIHEYRLHWYPAAEAIENIGDQVWVTMKLVKRYRPGDKLQVELLGMHRNRHGFVRVHEDAEPEKQNDGRLLEGVAVDTSRTIKRLKVDRKHSPLTITRIVRSPGESSQQPQQQQQQQSSSADAFTSFLLGTFSMSYQELVALPDMIQKMKASGTLELFETYIRSGHSNAQRVLKDALEEYMKK